VERQQQRTSNVKSETSGRTGDIVEIDSTQVVLNFDN
jgi:hypothetical protein